jgi:hypothetical protein
MNEWQKRDALKLGQGFGFERNAFRPRFDRAPFGFERDGIAHACTPARRVP